MLADLERKAERVRAGLITPAEARTAEHLATPIAEHFDAYLEALAQPDRGRAAVQRPGVSPNPGSRSSRLASSGRWPTSTAGLSSGGLNRRRQAKASARLRNARPGSRVIASPTGADPRSAGLTANPFKGVPKADEKADRRRQRRAMTEDELSRLLDVARRRPLIDAMTVHRGKRKGQAVANVGPETRERLEALGRERALIYKTLVLTGLRKNELATLTVGQLRLDEPTAYAELDAADEKNREGNGVPIRADLADDLRAWLADKLADARKPAMRNGEPIPAGLPGDTPLFTVPAGLVRIFDRDLKACRHPQAGRPGPHARRACIADDVRDAARARGECRCGRLKPPCGIPTRASPRTSTPTRGCSTSTGLSTRLPTLPLDAGPDAGRERARATGTDDHHPLAPPLALTWCKPSASGGIR